jgi:hypothetical protein
MSLNKLFSHGRFASSFFVASLLISLSSSSLSQPATLDGAIVKIPVVTVGDATFAVDLRLVPGTDPITFSLAAALEVPGADRTGASTFVDATLTIPTIQVGSDDLRVTMVLSSDSPVQFQLSGFSVNAAQQAVSARSLFETNVSSQIINGQCIACHVAGGPAGGTALVYKRSSATSVAENFATFEAFVASRSDAVEYILGQATGGTSGNFHTGGALLSVGTEPYTNFEAFLTALKAGN